MHQALQQGLRRMSLILPTIYQVGITIPISLIGKLRFRGFKERTHRYSADLTNPGFQQVCMLSALLLCSAVDTVKDYEMDE